VWGGRLVPLVAALSVLACGSARADLFDFSYSGGGITASGTLTATLQSGNTYLITGITGTNNGSSITGLLAPNTYYANDNLLFYPAGGDNVIGGYVDSGGLGYQVGGFDYKLKEEFDGSYAQIDNSLGHDGETNISEVTVSPDSAPAPIPGAGVLSYLLVMFGVAWRRREALLGRLREAISRVRTGFLPRHPDRVRA